MDKKLGVGTIYLIIASITGILTSYIMHIILARHLGPGPYGIFGVLMSLYQINRAFVQAGIPKATSKYLAEEGTNPWEIMKSSLILQIILSVVLTGVYLLLSSKIALLLHDPNLVNLIKIIGMMIIPISILFLYLDGYLNGLRKFRQEALIKILYSILKLILVLLFISFGLGILGALLGILTSIIISLIIVIILIKLNTFEAKSYFSKKKIMFFAIPIIGSSLGLILMRNIDTIMIKSILGDNISVGLYTSALNISNIPYVVFSSLTLTLLPTISKSTSMGDEVLTRKYINQSMRYLLLLLMPITALIAATSRNLIIFIYSADFVGAGEILSILIFSTTFLVIFLTLISVILGSGRPNIYMALTIIGTIILVILAGYFIPIYGIKGAAIASLISSAISLILSSIYVFSKFKALINIGSFVRIVLASSLIYVILVLIEPSGFALLIAYALLSILYLILLLILREIKNEDINLIRTVFQEIHNVFLKFKTTIIK